MARVAGRLAGLGALLLAVVAITSTGGFGGDSVVTASNAPEPAAAVTPRQLAPAGVLLNGPLTATAVAERTTHPMPATPMKPSPPATTVTTVTQTTTVTTIAPATTATPVTTASAGTTASTVPAESTPSSDTTAVTGDTASPIATDSTLVSAAPAGSASVHVVFGVGVGVAVTAATFTVRGANLRPGSTVTITSGSDSVLLGVAAADSSGSAQWDGVLPAGLTDGEHTLVVDAVANDGTALERITPFEVTAGVLIRLGESTIPTTTTTVTTLPTTAATVVAAAAAGGGGSGLPKLVLVLLLVAAIGLGLFFWRSKPGRLWLQNSWSGLRKKLKQPVGQH